MAAEDEVDEVRREHLDQAVAREDDLLEHAVDAAGQADGAAALTGAVCVSGLLVGAAAVMNGKPLAS